MKRTFMVCYSTNHPLRGTGIGRAFVTLKMPHLKLDRSNVELMENMVRDNSPDLAGATIVTTNIIEMEN